MAFGNKNSTPSFALTLPMKVTKQDEIFLSKKFRIGCMVYNQMVTKTTKMWHQLRKTREYKNLVKAIKAAPANSDERKALLVKRSNLIKQAGFSEGVFHKLVVPYQKAYNVNCDVAQKVASAVWKAWNDFFYGKGKTVHYKKLDDFVTLSGKKNNCGIFFRPANHTVSSLESAKRKAKNSIEKRYFDAFRKPDAKEGKEAVLPDEVKAQIEKEIADATAKIEPYIGDGNLRIIYEKHEFLVKVRNPDTQTGKYQQEALKCGVKYCRIVRSWVGTKWKYYAQLILEGYPPIKCDSNGVAKHPVKEGRIGIDIGTQTIAFCGKDVCDLRVLAPSAIAEARNGLIKEIARIMRQMDRSRRAMNPQYFNENGTVKRLKRKNGHKQIRHWNYSKNYYRLLHRLQDLNRKLAAVRKTEHYILANELLTYGNEFVVEDMNYKALQKRSKKTKINPKTGRAHTKKRFGKSIGRCAPALFITILGQKASRYGGSVIKVSTFETKASQFDHTDDSYTKKKLSQRFAKLSDGTIVQRDLYSAFLLLHLRKNLQSYNKKNIKKDFPQFKKLHDETKERLQNSHEWLPSSVGF